MSRLAREYPDQPDVWANPPMPVEQVKRPRRCWCGRGIGPMSSCDQCCIEHDHAEEVRS